MGNSIYMPIDNSNSQQTFNENTNENTLNLNQMGFAGISIIIIGMCIKVRQTKRSDCGYITLIVILIVIGVIGFALTYCGTKSKRFRRLVGRCCNRKAHKPDSTTKNTQPFLTEGTSFSELDRRRLAMHRQHLTFSDQRSISVPDLGLYPTTVPFGRAWIPTPSRSRPELISCCSTGNLILPNRKRDTNVRDGRYMHRNYAQGYTGRFDDSRIPTISRSRPELISARSADQLVIPAGNRKTNVGVLNYRDGHYYTTSTIQHLLNLSPEHCQKELRLLSMFENSNNANQDIHKHQHNTNSLNRLNIHDL